MPQMIAGFVLALVSGSAPRPALEIEVAPAPFPFVIDGARYPVPVVFEGKVVCSGAAPEGAALTVRLEGATGSARADLGAWKAGEAKTFRLALEAPAAGVALFRIIGEAQGAATASEAWAVPRVPAHPLLRGAVAACPRFRFVQMSDLHLLDRETVSSGVKTARNLETAVDEVNALDPPPAFVVVTGDVASDVGRGYALALEILGRIRVPFVILPGNHDFLKATRAATLAYASLGLPFFYSFDVGLWHFVCLNAQPDPAKMPVAGTIDPIQLAWLESDLRAASRPAMVFVHQSPVLGELQPGHGITNGADLRRVLEASGCVRWTFCGHVHFETFIEAGGIRHISTAAVAYPSQAQGYRHYRTGTGWRLVEVDGESVRTRFKALGGAWEDDPAPDAYLSLDRMKSNPMVEYPGKPK